MKMLILLAIILGCNNAVVAGNTAINDTEFKVVKAIDNDLEQAKLLLEKVVNINSGTMNFPGVKAVGDIFSAEFKELGFQTEWIDGKPFNRAGHLSATHLGQESKTKLLLIGHLDTVFAKDSHFQKYQRLDGDLNANKVKGPGITDMKGGDVVIIQALKALKSVGLLQQMNIKVIMTGDEEKRGSPHSIANKVMIDAAKWADIAIGFEDGDGDVKTAVVARRGAVEWFLEITGVPAHSSQIFQKEIGYGAIFEAARILNSFREELEPMTNLTFNPGVILGGTDVTFDKQSSRGTSFGKTNVVAQSLKVAGGIRATSAEQLEAAKVKMHKIVNNNLSKTTAKLSFKAGYPAMAPRKSNYELLALYNQISLDLGYGEVKAVDPRKAGAADISFTAAHVKMSLDGLGLMGTGGHTDNEIADMATLPQQIKRAALLFLRLTQQPQL